MINPGKYDHVFFIFDKLSCELQKKLQHKLQLQFRFKDNEDIHAIFIEPFYLCPYQYQQKTKWIRNALINQQDLQYVRNKNVDFEGISITFYVQNNFVKKTWLHLSHWNNRCRNHRWDNKNTSWQYLAKFITLKFIL